MTQVASFLERQGYVLHSGGAEGADTAFEKGVSCPDMKKIFLPWKGFNGNPSPLYFISKAAVDLAEQHHAYWHAISPAAKKLMARNVHQVLGEDLDTPVDMVICYTPNGKAEGGTGLAMRIAQHRNIPIINLYYNRDIDQISSWIETNTVFFIRNVRIDSWKLM
jgi:hypothetical protein